MPQPGSTGARIGWFITVGCVAAAVHWTGVVLLVSQWHWPPVVANVPAWLVAFVVSFAGHHRLTFRDHAAPWRVSATRFFVVSAGGFAVNEATYALLLRWNVARYDLLLALLLLVLAVSTYLLSRRWVFLRSPEP